MLAKIIGWGAGRPAALATLRRALDEYELLGVKTTLPFLRRLIADEAFARGAIYTRFLERRGDLFDLPPPGEDADALLAAALLSHARRGRGATAANGSHGDGPSEWRRAARRAVVDRQGGNGRWRSIT
jgi:acetyl/propionyl-CoA carboxylase alpha subunit